MIEEMIEQEYQYLFAKANLYTTTDKILYKGYLAGIEGDEGVFDFGSIILKTPFYDKSWKIGTFVVFKTTGICLDESVKPLTEEDVKAIEAEADEMHEFFNNEE